MYCSANISRRRFAARLVLVLLIWVGLASASPHARATGTRYLSSEYANQDALCSECHFGIASAYAKTAMAHASGPASEGPIQGQFFHNRSKVNYRLEWEGGKLWLDFDRYDGHKLNGRRELLYYIGSGKLKGRTYLFEVDGFLFESPINWYAQERLWDMTPNYENVAEAPLNLPVFPECLNCHTSGMQPPAAGTQNLYPEPPFAHGGITCERCHGPASEHALHGKEMMSLVHLPVDRRDEICMQCHLEGNASVERPHQHVYDFKPGDDLLDFVRYFVFANNGGQRAVSQFEALAQSRCKRVSGDKLSCTTCHDPHTEPEPSRVAAYFRDRCISCHGSAFAQKHHAENPNCVGCHMPALSSKDVSHTEETDHRILRHPAHETPAVVNSQFGELQPFPVSAKTKNDVRDLALAYESLVERGDNAASLQAERLLEQADKQDPDDAPILTGLGYIAQERGDINGSRQYYERALRNDSDNQEAATNLGVIEAKAGHLRRAVSLWQQVFKEAPWRSSVGLDIALGYCAANRYDEAKVYVKRVLEFNPDFAMGRSLLDRLSANPPDCSLSR